MLHIPAGTIWFLLLLFIYGYQIVGRFSYSRKTKFGGVYRNYLVRPSNCLYNRPDSYMSYEETFKVHTWQKDCLWPRSVWWFWPKVIWSSSRSLKGNVKYSCSDHIFLMDKTLKLPTSHKDCLRPEGLSWFSPMAIIASSRSLEGTVQNFIIIILLLLLIFLMENH